MQESKKRQFYQESDDDAFDRDPSVDIGFLNKDYLDDSTSPIESHLESDQQMIFARDRFKDSMARGKQEKKVQFDDNQG